MRVVGAAHWEAAISGRTNRNFACRVISDISIHVGVHHVLPGCVQLRECLREFLPVLGCIHVKEGNAHAIVKCPTQCQRPRLARDKIRDDRSMAGKLNINVDVRLALDVNNLLPVLGLHPSLGSLIRALIVKVLDVNVSHGRAHVGEAPRHALVVAHNHVWQPRQRYTRNVECGTVQVRLIPQVRHLVTKVHIIR